MTNKIGLGNLSAYSWKGSDTLRNSMKKGFDLNMHFRVQRSTISGLEFGVNVVTRFALSNFLNSTMIHSSITHHGISWRERA